MVTNFDLTINKSNGLWTIKFVVNDYEIVWSGEKEKEILGLYHSLAQKVNKEFRTDFDYSEELLTDYYFNIQKSKYNDVYTLFVNSLRVFRRAFYMAIVICTLFGNNRSLFL